MQDDGVTSRLTDADGADVDEFGTLRVWGDVPPGAAVRLSPRRYKSTPAWAVVEVVAVGGDAAGVGAQRFELSCASAGLWGTEGIEVLGASTGIRIARP